MKINNVFTKKYKEGFSVRIKENKFKQGLNRLIVKDISKKKKKKNIFFINGELMLFIFG